MEMPIPNDWNGETYCRYAICWPDSAQWLAILRGQVTEPARGWFWSAESGNLLETLEKFRETMSDNIQLREVIMACNDESLLKIAAALELLAQNQCCEGGNGGGVTGSYPVSGGGYNPIYGTVTPGEVPEGEVPFGFEGTVEDYLISKCATAAVIVSGLITTLRNFAFMSITQAALTATVVLAAVGGFIVLPVVLIAVLVGYLLVTAGSQHLLSDLADEIEGNYDTWVCKIYNSGSVNFLWGNIQELLDTAIDAIGATGTLGVALEGIVRVLLNANTLEKLYSASVGGVAPYTCDCGCDSGEDVIFDFTEGIIGWVLQPGVTFSDPNYNTLVGPGVLSWNEPNGSIQLAMGSGTPNSRMTAIVPVIHTIQEGDGFYCRTEVTSGTITFNWFLARSDGTVIVADGFGTGSTGNQTRDLTEFVGSEVGYIGLWAAKAQSTAFELNVPYVRISCEGP